jgi:hypothetical protein
MTGSTLTGECPNLLSRGRSAARSEPPRAAWADSNAATRSRGPLSEYCRSHCMSVLDEPAQVGPAEVDRGDGA